MSQRAGVYIAGAVLIIIAILVGALLFLPHESEERLMLQVEQRQLSFLVADTAPERYLGLSGWEREDLAGTTGMAFLFSESAIRTFSMRGMTFDLDFVWVLDGEVVKVDSSVPAPLGGAEPSLIASAPEQADMVLELPSGQAVSLGFKPGVQIQVKR